jgi:tRNA threonylcarbamoyladenosine biosynthesis protein TsaB
VAYLLSLETSSTLCSVALGENANILYSIHAHQPHQHDRLLAIFVEHVCANAGIRVTQIDAVCISSGPGSFSGLRIGGALAKALCFDNQPALISVPTLTALAKAMAEQAQLCNATTIITTQASHKDILTWQAFRVQSDMSILPTNDIAKCTYEELLTTLTDKYSADTLLCTGTALTEPLQALLKALPHPQPIYQYRSAPTAVMIYPDGWKMFQRGETIRAEMFVPHYGQEFIPL